MDMFRPKQPVIRGAITGLVVAGLTYVVLLVYGANQLSGVADQSVSFIGKVGPWQLFSLNKQPGASGPSASMAFLSGSLYFFAALLITGVIGGYIWQRLRPKDN